MMFKGLISYKGLIGITLAILLSGCGISSQEHYFSAINGDYVPAGVGFSSPPGSGGGSGTTGGKTDAETIEQNCETLAHQQYEQELFFPDPGENCAWEQNGNGARQNLEIRARLRQDLNYDLPDNALICNMEFSSDEQQMRFDDEIFLLLNNRVLLSSDDYSDRLPVVDEMSTWDWDSLYGTPYAYNLAPGFCLGEELGLATCEIPETEQWGHISISFAPQLMYDLSSALSGEDDMVFSFITTGDNDNSDCRHEDFSFTVAVNYVVPE